VLALTESNRNWAWKVLPPSGACGCQEPMGEA